MHPVSLPDGRSCPESCSTIGATDTGRVPVIFGGSAQLHGITVPSFFYYSVQRRHNTMQATVAICNPDADTLGGWLSSVDNSRAPTWNRRRGSVNRHLPTPPGLLPPPAPVWLCSSTVAPSKSRFALPRIPLQIGLHEGHPDVQNRSALEPWNSREAVS